MSTGSRTPPSRTCCHPERRGGPFTVEMGRWPIPSGPLRRRAHVQLGTDARDRDYQVRPDAGGRVLRRSRRRAGREGLLLLCGDSTTTARRLALRVSVAQARGGLLALSGPDRGHLLRPPNPPRERWWTLGRARAQGVAVAARCARSEHRRMLGTSRSRGDARRPRRSRTIPITSCGDLDRAARRAALRPAPMPTGSPQGAARGRHGGVSATRFRGTRA